MFCIFFFFLLLFGRPGGLSAQTNRLRRYSLLSLTRFTTLRNTYGGVIQDDREVFALPSSRFHNFLLSPKMCKDKV
nr:MAG TPA: hypothetical protein [Microviridae sp.]